MNRRYPSKEKLAALFLLAVLLFNPPLILIFDSPATAAGIPVLYVYLFVSWALLIVLCALISELSFSPEPDDRSTDASGFGRDPSDGS
ncbi:MAG: hypothetical protein ACR2PG_19350 [Hyphomicrobiaceae bacterium]